MATTDGASHLSIGEVLSLLQVEFPDVTISKIRFLESQGLIDPERTPSGYRKFYEADIVRLRWVLRQQRDHFLPLKVIKSKLESGADLDVDDDDDQPAQPTLWSDSAPADASAIATVAASPAPSPTAVAHAAPTLGVVADPGPTHRSVETEVDPAGTGDVAAESHATGDRPSAADSAAWLAALQESPVSPAARAASPRSVPPRPVVPPAELASELAGQRYDLAELSAASGLAPEVVEELVEFGLIHAGRLGGEVSFDGAALLVASAAASFVERGIEPRHLRSYKLGAEREAGLFEQLILPLLRQRNPQSQQVAGETLAQLTEAGETLRRALLHQSLDRHLRSQ